MGEEHLISVIIPAFNAEKTIGISIESVQKQTYFNWELIIVNDGSSDDTEKVCEKYILEDDRITYLEKANGGVSSARNIGIQAAKGEYIVFCDSDDYFEIDALEKLITAAIENQADFVIPRSRGVYYLSDGRFDKYVMNDDDFELIINYPIDKNDFEKLRRSSSIYSTCGRMYRRDFLVEYRVLFNENIKVLEDFCFNLQCLQYAKVVTHKSCIVYNYLVYGIEEYKFRRSYKNYIVSLPYVYESLKAFLAKKEMEMEQSQIDLIMGYWIFALENVLVSKENLLQKSRSIKQILDEVQKEKLYNGCTKEYLDTHFKVLFKKKSIWLFLGTYYLKKIKQMVK